MYIEENGLVQVQQRTIQAGRLYVLIDIRYINLSARKVLDKELYRLVFFFGEFDSAVSV